MGAKIKVAGMTCMHCVHAVKRALEQVPGVNEAQVDLEKGEAVVSGIADGEAMVAAIKEAGYAAELM